VKALVFRHSLGREAIATIGGRVDRRAFVSRFAPVRIEDVDELPLPGADWIRVKTTFSGLCGSDVKQILLNGSRDNPLTALVSFPHVLGHEVVGRRADTGDRVVLNPWLSCVPRGIDPPCEACHQGRYPCSGTSTRTQRYGRRPGRAPGLGSPAGSARTPCYPRALTV
jgi:threonine dehydrogenase-like Zn-dependent dehydrogenase